MTHLTNLKDRLLREKEWLLNHLESWFQLADSTENDHKRRARELLEIEKSLAQLDPDATHQSQSKD